MSETFLSEPIFTVAELPGVLARLAAMSAEADDATLIDGIAALEKLKAVACAVQARFTVAFKASQLETQKAAAAFRREDLGKGIGGQVALARQESPHRGARLVGLADALVNEMPHTLAALTAGDISEWRATLVVRETACLSREDRRVVDARLAGRLGSLSDRGVVAEARRIGYALDAAAVMARSAKAVAERRVTIRPAPETMTVVSALLPAAEGVAVFAALTRAADTRRAAGDARTRGQVMADTLVERLTGQATADQVPVEVQLVMTSTGLLGGDDTPARLTGYGPIPAGTARGLIRGLDDSTRAWLRRLLTDPHTGQLTALDTTRRLFTGLLRRAVVIRDEYCRTPWCGAPIRHLDHPLPVEAGGSTSATNGQGLCEACNYTKQAPGWTSRPGPGGAGDSIDITTPTGHRYTSRPPPLPGAPPPFPRGQPPRAPRPLRIDLFTDHPMALEYAA